MVSSRNKCLLCAGVGPSKLLAGGRHLSSKKSSAKHEVANDNQVNRARLRMRIGFVRLLHAAARICFSRAAKTPI
jgi:hypothetical protein